MGDRPEALERAITSIRRVSGCGDATCISVVVNSGTEVTVPAGVLVRSAGRNLGIPGGRNLAAGQSDADVLIFVDDDGRMAFGDNNGLQRVGIEQRLESHFADPSCAVVAFRVSDPQTGTSLSRWNPRLFGRDALLPGEVTRFPGGAVAIRKSAFEQVGRYPAEFWYAHEESDLSLRLIDAGWSIYYDPAIVLEHPAHSGASSSERLRHSSRNRVWLARRNLPWLIGVAHVGFWFAISVIRSGNLSRARAVWEGTKDGLREFPFSRQPISWSTALKLTRLGRPPIL